MSSGGHSATFLLAGTLFTKVSYVLYVKQLTFYSDSINVNMSYDLQMSLSCEIDRFFSLEFEDMSQRLYTS